MTDFMHFVDSAGEHRCVVFLKGTADVANHDHFERAMSDAQGHPAKFVVLDIRELGFITSLGVGEILRLHKAKKQAGGHVVIVGPNQYVEGVFKAARLTSVMTIVATVDEGLEACGKG